MTSSSDQYGLHGLQVASSAFLNNRLVEVVAFMEGIALKDATDKVGGSKT